MSQNFKLKPDYLELSVIKALLERIQLHVYSSMYLKMYYYDDGKK